MPLLWTRIPLLTPDMKYTTNTPFLEFYTGFLLRSAGQPIGVFVSSHDAKAEKAVKWHPAIKILVSHSYRTAGVAASRTAKNLVQYINHYFKYFDNLNFK